MKQIITAAMLLAAVVTAAAEESELVFSYANPNAELGVCGFKIADTYDVCIKIKNSGLTGQDAKIVGVQIPVVNEDAITDYSVWVTSDYGFYDRMGKPVTVDKCRVDCTPVDGVIDVRFDEAIDLPEEGLYVGYTFTVNSANNIGTQYPVVCTAESVPNALFIRTQNKYISWQDDSGSRCSPMKVILRGNFNLNGAGVNPIHDVYSRKGEPTVAKVGIVNNSISEIADIDYTLDIDGEKVTGNYRFETPIANVIGAETVIDLEIPAWDAIGDHRVVLSIDKVNGEANNWEDHSTEFHYVVVEELPHRRVVMEEWTGTWCQYCPRGFAGMEMVKENDREVILVSYHYNDVMEMALNNPTDKAWSYPCAYLDKTVAVDPLTGTNNLQDAYGYILTDYAERKAVQAPVAVNIKSQWNDDKSVLDVEATAEFIYTPTDDYDYRFAYALVADGLCSDDPTDSSWWQQNYYGQFPETFGKIPFLGDYANLGSPITDMVYDDVAVYSSPYRGVADSMKEVKGGTPLTYSFKIKTAKCVNKKNKLIVQDTDNLRIVVMVVRSKSKDDIEVLNANECKAGGDTTGVSPVTAADATVVGEEIYDIAGHRISGDSKGLQIVVSRYSDGTTKANKRIIK